MYCEYCGKEIDENNKFCPNCGAGLTEEAQAESIENSTANAKADEQFYASANAGKSEKKKTSPAKIILIVFLVSALIVGGIVAFLFGMYAFFKNDVNTDYTEDEIEDYFEQYFDERFDFDDDFGFDIDDFDEGDDFIDRIDGGSSNISGNYKGVKNFKSGKIDRDTNSYSSEFNGLDFQLPTGYSIYSEKKLNALYDEQYVPTGLVGNKLYLYDIYAENNINGATFYISYFNEDYFSDEYDNIGEFIEDIKDASEEYRDYNYTVTFAKDSKITLDDAEYTMIAAKITNEAGKEYYQYDFVREVNGYYMQVSLFAESLDDIGEIIDVINAKG